MAVTPSMSPLLLDTNAAIWLSRDELKASASEKLDEAARAGVATWLSPITAWEVGLLVSHNRLSLGATPQRWFARLLSIPNVRLAELSPDILIASSFLPGKPPRDPADRILLATARDLGATLITRDRWLLKYGEDGQVSTIEC
jgi:PIN domain nuclease of toxin-antitoxin system